MAEDPELIVLDLRASGEAAGNLRAAEQAEAVRALLNARAVLAGRGDEPATTVVVLGTQDQAAAVLPGGVAVVTPVRGASEPLDRRGSEPDPESADPASAALATNTHAWNGIDR